jgi:GNAT superfamily N-acetyltransferase
MEYRFAELGDVPLLAEANARLHIDEGAAERPGRAEIERDWHRRLSGDYRAVIFEHDGRPAAYALYVPEDDTIVLEQFWVRRELRRKGLGREAFELLREEIWRPGARVRTVCPPGVTGAAEFLAAMGFAERGVVFEARFQPPAEFEIDET